MQCPECSAMMEVTGFKGIAIYQCIQCNSKWFEGDELSVIRARKERELSWLDVYPHTTLIRNPEAQSILPCPRCSLKMGQMAYKDSSIVVHTCFSCKGLWYSDASFLELMRVSSHWVTKHVPRHLIIIVSLSVMALTMLMLALFMTLMKRIPARDNPESQPFVEKPGLGHEQELKDMRFKNDMATDMMKQNEMMSQSEIMTSDPLSGRRR